MADLIIRPETPARAPRPVAPGPPGASSTPSRRSDDSPRRAAASRRSRRSGRRARRAIRIEVDGRVVEGFEGQTILEVCRDNGIEIPTLCYEPKLPGFGACRMCVVEVEGEDHAADLLLARRPRRTWWSATQTEELRRIRRTNLELIFSRPQRLLPAARARTSARATSTSRASSRPTRRPTGASRRGSSSARSRSPACSAACAPPRARSTAAGTRWTRRSRSATATATPATRSSGRCSTRASTRRCRSRSRPRPAAAPRSSAPGPAGMSAAYYLLLAGHDVTVFERDPPPAACSATASRSTACPRSRSSRPSTSRSPASAARCAATWSWAGTSRSTTSRTRASTRRHRHRLLRHQQAGHPERGRRRRHRRPRVPAHGHARPAVPGPRGHPGRRRRRRLHRRWTASRTSVRQGASEVTLVYRRDMKDMPASQRGPRGHRGGRHRHLPGRPDARHHGREDRQGHGHRVHPDAAGRARRVRPAPPGARRPAPSSRSPATACCSPSARARSSLDSAPATRASSADASNRRLEADAVTFETGAPGRVRHRRRPDRRRDRRPGDRRGPPRRLRRGRLPQGQRPGRHPHPPDARRAAARVPLDRAVHRRDQGAALPPQGARGRGPQHATTSSTRSRTPATRPMAESTRCLQCTCEAIGFCDLRRLGIEYGTTLKTLEPQFHQGAGYRSRHREPVHRRQPRLRPRRQPRVHPARARRAASTAAGAPTCAPRSWAPPATTSCGSASTPW